MVTLLSVRRLRFHGRALQEGFLWLKELVGWWGPLAFVVALVSGTVLPAVLTGFPVWAEVIIGSVGMLLLYAEGAYRIGRESAVDSPPLPVTITGGTGPTIVNITSGDVNLSPPAEWTHPQGEEAPPTGGGLGCSP